MNNVASGAWAAPRTSITASQDNFYESCPSQALRLALPGGPCADAIPAIKPFSAGMVTAECRVVAMAMKAQPAPFPPKCCPLLRQFIGDGCACESATLFVSPIGNVSAVDLVAATRAAQVSFCASDEYGGPMHNPCRNIKSCETFAQLGQKTPAKPVAAGATAAAAPVVKPAAVKPGSVAAPVGGGQARAHGRWRGRAACAQRGHRHSPSSPARASSGREWGGAGRQSGGGGAVADGGERRGRAPVDGSRQACGRAGRACPQSGGRACCGCCRKDGCQGAGCCVECGASAHARACARRCGRLAHTWRRRRPPVHPSCGR